MAWENIQILS